VTLNTEHDLWDTAASVGSWSARPDWGRPTSKEVGHSPLHPITGANRRPGHVYDTEAPPLQAIPWDPLQGNRVIYRIPLRT